MSKEHLKHKRGAEMKDPLAEMKESEFWNEAVPGIEGWTYGKMIEKALEYDKSLIQMTEDEWREMF